MGKNTYKEVLASLKDKAKDSKGYSKSALTELTTSLINDTDYVAETFEKSGDKMEKKTSEPVKAFRNSMKKIVTKQFGVDAADAAKLDTCELPKDLGAAVNEVATIAMKDYLSTGKKLNFPVTTPTESKMGIQIVSVDEKTVETTKVVKNDNGSYDVVPTGKKVTTKKHDAIKATNKVPFWLKTEVEIKK